jgi:septal ring factor EnvC (AmiA/AmiB activator)
MKNIVQQRLKQLKNEFESGQKMMADLEAKRANLETTLLRISGAIQVLEELLSQSHDSVEENMIPGRELDPMTQLD